jgi:hypothetical protein
VATKETQADNETQGNEELVPCSKCNGKTSHKVLQSIDKSGEETDGAWVYRWNVQYQIIQCQGCKTISFRKASTNSEDYIQTGPQECEYIVSEDIYPSRVEGRRGLADEVHYFPAQVQRIYAETLQALNSRSPILAGIGLRALLETICQEKNAQGSNLLKRWMT